jgi:hypothetical protein
MIAQTGPLGAPTSGGLIPTLWAWLLDLAKVPHGQGCSQIADPLEETTRRSLGTPLSMGATVCEGLYNISYLPAGARHYTMWGIQIHLK